MEDNQKTTPWGQTKHTPAKPLAVTVKVLFRILISAALLAAGFIGFTQLKSCNQQMQRKPQKKVAAMVRTIQVAPADYQRVIHAMGTVQPDNQIVLRAKVTGEVTSISDRFVEGGILKKGQTLLTIEDSDYLIEIQKAQSALDKALADLSIEKGSQTIAKEELKLINEAVKDKMVATDLSMRKPQLVKAKAAVASAAADLEKARLNLERTNIKIPFNALILEKNVSLGSQISTQEAIATLVETDHFQVEALVPPDRLSHISFNRGTPSQAVIRSQYSDDQWQGTVTRMTGALSDKGRLAGVIIQVADPLGVSNPTSPRLLLDDHVNVDIYSSALENVIQLERTCLRDNETVWIFADGKLDIRKVTVVWKQKNKVFIRQGLTAEDRIIVTDLPAPVRGMALQAARAGDR